MKRILRATAIAMTLLAITLAGCKDGNVRDPSGGGSSTSGDSGGTSGTGDEGTGIDSTQRSVRIGSFGGTGSFNEGEVATNNTSLDAGESASLTAVLIDQNGEPVTDEVDVFFSSTCITSGIAEIEPAVVTNNDGTVTATYTARGCDGADTITAQTSVDGASLSATVSLQTQQAPLGAISFLSASRQVIGIKGTGAIPEQSVVSFKVTNASGGAVPNQVVDFSLNTEVGGIALSNVQDTTDANGIASTTISSGTVATTVRVTATATNDGTTTTALSSGLAVSTGIPDQDSFSVSADTLNMEAWDIDGVTNEITVRLADRFNNPVPDGTAVNFTAEGGSVESSCVTTGGACSVIFTSQQPRPANGRITVLATAIGEESFKDADPSNGEFDDAEEPSLGDIPEAFRDDDENLVRDGDEFFVDFNGDSTHNAPDGLFNGLLCNGPGLCSGQNTLTIFDEIVLIMSDDNIDIGISPSPIDLDSGSATVTVTLESAGNGQVPAAGSTISVSTTQGTIVGSTSFEMPNTTYDPNPPNGPALGPLAFDVKIEPGDSAGNGNFIVKVTSPNGTISEAFTEVTQTVTP